LGFKRIKNLLKFSIQGVDVLRFSKVITRNNISPFQRNPFCN